MPDGTGDEPGSPTLATLKQMSWDLSYIRDKLTLNSVSKTFIWRREATNHQLILGLIVIEKPDLLTAIRSMANSIQAGADGQAPAIEGFGQSGFTSTQLTAMYENLKIIVSLIRDGKRTLTMRMSGLAGSNVELTAGGAGSSSISYRQAIASLANQIIEGSG